MRSKENMKIQIIGNGAFGSFLSELLAPHCEIVANAETVILAVPIGAYASWGAQLHDRHLVNVCSVQKPSTDALLKSCDRVTSLHPLFGRRTPPQFRNSIVTYVGQDNDTWFTFPEQEQVLSVFASVSSLYYVDHMGKNFTPESHDKLMEKTHMTSLMAAKQMKVFTDRVENVPDHLIPHSFRLMRNFVQTLEDMPKGTVESIMANPNL